MGKESRWLWTVLRAFPHTTHKKQSAATASQVLSEDATDDGRYLGGTGQLASSTVTSGKLAQDGLVHTKSLQTILDGNRMNDLSTRDLDEYLDAASIRNRHKGGWKMKKLHSAHDGLQALRDEVNVQKEALQAEYEDLDHRLGDVCSSQNDLMEAFEQSFINRTLDADHEILYSIWQTSCRDIAMWQARITRIRQLLDLAIEPEARLIVADGDFLDEAENIMTSLAHVSGNDAHQRTPGPETLLGTRPSLVERLSTRRKDIEIYQQRLDELNYEHEEESLEREFLLDRGDLPEISETRFSSRYNTAKDQIERDLRQATADATNLESACADRGYNIPNLVDANGVLGPADQDSTVESEIVGSDGENDNVWSPGGTPTAVKAFGEAQQPQGLWSQESLAGLPPQDPDTVAFTEDWVKTLQHGSIKPYDAEESDVPITPLFQTPTNAQTDEPQAVFSRYDTQD